MVWATRFELATSQSRTARATNCATPRCFYLITIFLISFVFNDIFPKTPINKPQSVKINIMKEDSQSKPIQPLLLAGLLLVYFLLCSQFLLKPVSNTEASNYLNFFQLTPTGQPVDYPRHNFLPLNLYFGPLKLWTQVFGYGLAPIRSFSVFCGAFVILIFFLILKNKLNVRNILSFIAILTLNPLFIHFSTNFDSTMALLLVITVLYSGIILLYRLKLKSLISFRRRRLIINWRSFVLKDTPPSRTKTIFSLATSILAITLIVGTLLIGLKQDISLRKLFIAIYQSKIIANSTKSNSQPNQQNTPVLVDQQYSSHLIVENILVARELGKDPLPIYWSISINSIEKQFKDQRGFWLLGSQKQTTSILSNQVQEYHETEFIAFDNFYARYFVTEK